MKGRNYELRTLPNGLRVLHVPMPESAAVFLALTGAVGRRAEEDHEVGAAHFLEHLFFEGTDRRPNAYEIMNFIDELGGIRNGITSQDRVSYYVKILTEHREAAFDFVSDIFLHSKLEEIEKNRKVIAQEAAMRRDDPAAALVRHRITTLYPGQRLGRTIFDEDVNLHNMTREVLEGYMRRMYVAQNFILTVAGNISQSETFALAEQYFGTIPSGEAAIPPPGIVAPEPVVQIENRPLKQSKLSLAFSAFPANHQLAPAADLLATILGGGSSSRLHNRLRHQKHLVYSVFSGTGEFLDTGFFAVTTYVGEENLQVTVTEIVAEINELLAGGILEAELNKAKNMVLSQLLFAAENPVFVGNNYAVQQLLSGRIYNLDEQADAIRSVSTKDIMEAARTIFADAPKVNIITESVTSLEVPEIRA